jgi:hypothetical protein
MNSRRSSQGCARAQVRALYDHNRQTDQANTIQMATLVRRASRSAGSTVKLADDEALFLNVGQQAPRTAQRVRAIGASNRGIARAGPNPASPRGRPS